MRNEGKAEANQVLMCTRSRAVASCAPRELQRDGRYDLPWRRFTSEPMRIEAPTKSPTFSLPTAFTLRIQCKPVLAMQPHCAQSGVPPKTHGSTRVRKSAV